MKYQSLMKKIQREEILKELKENFTYKVKPNDQIELLGGCSNKNWKSVIVTRKGKKIIEVGYYDTKKKKFTW